ncbi:MAG: hypothetical protein JSW42_12915 [Chloroflexota bacterium]|nr:MAG: hypothetical protein JSW42_12915 [Chloroflexota bacterium]
MKIQSGTIILLVYTFLSACAGIEAPSESATPAPWDPLPSDSEMQRVEIEQVDVEIIQLESDTSQFALQIEGALPTPCNHLRVELSFAEDQSSVEVEIYSVVDPDEICILVLEPFSEVIPLPEGDYQVSVNNEIVGNLSP